MQINKFVSSIIGIILSTTIATVPTINTFAATVNSSEEQETEYQEIQSNTTALCDIYANMSSSFNVTIPKTIVLTGSSADSGAAGAYSVMVKGNISSNETITVEPDESVTMNQEGKDSVSAQINQTKKTWKIGEDGVTETNIATGVSTTGSIIATLSAGKWNGAFNFNINKQGRAIYTLTGENAASNPNGATLDSDDLLKTSDDAVIYVYNGIEYKAFNGYASYTEYATQADAEAFIQLLNDNAVDGHTDWKLFNITSDNYAEADAWQEITFTDGTGILNNGIADSDITDIVDGSSIMYLWSSANSGDVANPVCYWNTSDGECYSDVDSSQSYSGFIPVHPIDTSGNLLIIFNANGGTVSTSTMQMALNSAYGTLPTPTWDGHTFDGWYTSKIGGTRVNDTDIATMSCVLYAHWAGGYTLTDGNTFNSVIPDTATAIAFTNDAFPTGRTETTSAPEDETTWVQLGATSGDDIRGWLSGTTFIISSGNDSTIFADVDSSYMFYDKTNLNTIDFTNLNTSNVTDMCYMFAASDSSAPMSLLSLDLSGFNTSNVTDMTAMFENCTNLSTLNISSLNTENTTSMAKMFHNCLAIATLDVSGFNTGNVTDMQYMFANDNARTPSTLSTIDVSNWNMENVVNTCWMFENCSNLITLDVSNWNTSNIENMAGMFSRCLALNTLDVSNWNTENVTTMRSMFSVCRTFTSLDISGWNTENVTDMANMFAGCSSLVTIYAGTAWDTSAVTSSTSMFLGCVNLVGGNGTVYNNTYIDVTYARIDTADAPGYLRY